MMSALHPSSVPSLLQGNDAVEVGVVPVSEVEVRAEASSGLGSGFRLRSFRV